MNANTPVDAAAAPTTPAHKGAFGVVFFTLFMDMLGFGIIIPIQPFYAESFGATPMVVTWLSASYSVMQLFFSPLWGRLSDRIGRRPVVLTSIAIGAVGFLVFGFAQGLWMLFAARMVAGFGNANIGTVQAIISDITTGKDRAKGMGILGAAFGMGFIFGPVIGALVNLGWGPSAPAFVAAALGLVNLIFAYFKLPETRDPNAPARGAVGIFNLGALSQALRIKNLPQLFLIFFIYSTGFSLMETSISLFLETDLVPHALYGSAEGRKQASLLTMYMLLVVGVASAVVQGGLISKLKARFGEKRLLVAGCMLVAVGFVTVTRSPPIGFWVVLVGSVIIAAGSGIISPSLSSMLSRSAPQQRQGEFLGLGQSMSALGRIAGPLMSGVLFERIHSLPLLTGAALVSVGGAVGLSLAQPSDDVDDA